MSRRRLSWYLIARPLAWLSLTSLSATLAFLVASLTFEPESDPPGMKRAFPRTSEIPEPAPIDLPTIALIVSACAVCVTTVGTASTVILGWRNERRQSAEFRLKIEQLELQLAEARRSASASDLAPPEI